MWWVYVAQSLKARVGKTGNDLPGFHYVGMTTEPSRRLRQHNGEIKGGAKYTSQHKPWKLVKVYGPYESRSDALKAEYALKHGKRGVARTQWSANDSAWYKETDESKLFLVSV